MHHADVNDKKKLLPMQTHILSSNKIHMSSIHTTYPYTTSYTHGVIKQDTHVIHTPDISIHNIIYTRHTAAGHKNIHISMSSNTHLVDSIRDDTAVRECGIWIGNE